MVTAGYAGRMSLRYEVSDRVGVVTLDRPDVLNAFDDEMGRAALDAVNEAASDEEVRCIVITGSGRAFSSGEDLGALADGYRRGEAPPLGDTLVKRYNPLIRALTTAPKPVLAAVNGVAAGAGASVVLACDHRIASENAKLVLAFIKVGLVPDSGALWFLARMLGTARAWTLCSSGDPLDAAKAMEWGIYEQVVSADEFEAAWRRRASELASGPTSAYALTKALLYGAASKTLDDQLDEEVAAQTAAGATADHIEGVQAFFDRRPPEFKGR
jgi:2-(1,2-epoxy-1,2-dihydrophenyl)acetyl-CoA isomerase